MASVSVRRRRLPLRVVGVFLLFACAASPTLAGIDDSHLDALYAARHQAPIWGAARRAVLRTAIAQAEAQGLGLPKDAASPSDAAATDRALSRTALLLIEGLSRGTIDPAMIYRDYAAPRPTDNSVATLTAATRSNNPGTDGLAAMFATLAPGHRDYRALAEALARYRAIAADGGWPVIPAGSEVKLGGTDRRLQLLGKRLMIEGDLAREADDIAAAVRRFQARHGLAADGRVGPATLAALNVSAAARAEQIALNLERWRWLPRELGPRHVRVNAADAVLALYDGDRPVLKLKAIVGDRRHPTPVFRATIRGVVVNPPWNIPATIARAEMLPKLRRNPAYLKANNIEIVGREGDDPHGLQIDWRKVSGASFPFQLRQRPGPDNSLGGIKLDMPNRFDVYLHDTPAKSLFDRPQRNFSHGCVRVEHAAALAGELLGAAGRDGHALVAARAVEPETAHLALSEPVPVYLLYFTAFVDPGGTAQFRPDVYGRDAVLAAALSRSGRIAPAPAPADAVGCGPES